MMNTFLTWINTHHRALLFVAAVGAVLFGVADASAYELAGLALISGGSSESSTHNESWEYTDLSSDNSIHDYSTNAEGNTGVVLGYGSTGNTINVTDGGAVDAMADIAYASLGAQASTAANALAFGEGIAESAFDANTRALITGADVAKHSVSGALLFGREAMDSSRRTFEDAFDFGRDSFDFGESITGRTLDSLDDAGARMERLASQQASDARSMLTGALQFASDAGNRAFNFAFDNANPDQAGAQTLIKWGTGMMVVVAIAFIVMKGGK